MGLPMLKRQWLRRELHRRWDASFADALQAYGNALRKWISSYSNELAQQFDSETAAFEGQLRMSRVRVEHAGMTHVESIESDIARLSQ